MSRIFLVALVASASTALPINSLAQAPRAAAAPASVQAPAGRGFDKTLSLQGISFRVSSANAGSVNQLRIQPSGLKDNGANALIEKEIDGTVVDCEVDDLNVDGSPELYVYVSSAGSGSYGSLVAYSVNKGKSITEIYIPPLTDDAEASAGYRGHDEFRVVESVLVRRFPLYREGDTNAQPSGGIRQIQYRLKAGEAGWVLRVDQVIQY